MTHITEFATAPQKRPSTPRLHFVGLQTTDDLVALSG